MLIELILVTNVAMLGAASYAAWRAKQSIEYVEAIIEQKQTEIPKMVMESFFGILRDDEKRLEFQQFFLNEAFFKQIGEVIMSSIMSHITGNQGQAKSEANKVIKGMTEDVHPIGKIIAMLPDNKWTKILKEKPETWPFVMQFITSLMNRQTGIPLPK